MQKGRYRKKIRRILLFMLVVALAFPATILADTTIVKTEAKKKPVEKEKTEELQVPLLKETMLLYKGERSNLKVANVGGASKVSFQSSNPKVASVSKYGKVEAKSCGKAEITVEMKRGDKISRAQIQIVVRISSFYHTKNYSKGVRIQRNTTKTPFINFHKTLIVKKKFTIKLEGLAEDAVVSYQSKNRAVATVDKDGIIYAKKKGTALIDISVKQNNTVYRYREVVHVVSGKEKAEISMKVRNQYFSKSAFIGSSIGVGQKMYFDSMGAGFLGNPIMLVKGNYSFLNDKNPNSSYRLTYRGKTYAAKDAIAVCGADRVFINMGINDLWQDADSTYEDYAEYLQAIKKKNPKVVIFIESTTPVHASTNKQHLNNDSVDRLNTLMKQYCEKNKNMYYIDINTALKDSSGALKEAYTSDRYVHLSMEGYRVWTGEVVRYVEKLLVQEQKAKDAVVTVTESRLKSDYKTAKKLVLALDNSSVKSELWKKLKKIKRFL